jgi:L-threonylcarbamoyladenylate synthase
MTGKIRSKDSHLETKTPGESDAIDYRDRVLLSVVADSICGAGESFLDRFWPGPLILILPSKKNLPRLITAGTQRVAVRIPGDSFALHLAGIAGFPITATSANPSGMPPARDAETVIKYFKDDIDLIIDAGPTPGILPSTIVDMTGDTVNILEGRDGQYESLLLNFNVAAALS